MPWVGAFVSHPSTFAPPSGLFPDPFDQMHGPMRGDLLWLRLDHDWVRNEGWSRVGLGSRHYFLIGTSVNWPAYYCLNIRYALTHKLDHIIIIRIVNPYEIIRWLHAMA